jgi:hypothetical protein
VAHPVDSHAGGVLESIHRDGDIDVVGKCIARRHRIFVGWRQQELARVRLEIELFLDVDDHRPASAVVPGRCRNQHGRPAQRLQADRPHTGLLRNQVGPGTGGVHEHGRRKYSSARVHLPYVADALDPGLAGTRDELHTCMPALPQVTEVDRCNVHVVTGFVEQAARDPAVTEQRALVTSLGRIERSKVARDLIRIQHRLEQKNPGRVSDEQGATRTEQPRVGKSTRGLLEKMAACPGQRSNRLIAVAFEEHRRRPPGGMQSRLVLCLEQDHATTRCQFGSDGSAGHARAQHDDVCVFQGSTIGDVSGNWPPRYLGHRLPANGHCRQ